MIAVRVTQLLIIIGLPLVVAAELGLMVRIFGLLAG